MEGTGVQKRNIDNHEVLIHGENSTISAEVPEEVAHEGFSADDETMIYSNPSELLKKGATPSFSIIRFAKVKNFIDGVYAAVEERVAEKGHTFSRSDFLNNLEKIVTGDAKKYINSAIEKTTLNEPSLKIPQGFYDWSDELREVYKQIKITGKEPSFFINREEEDFDERVVSEIKDLINKNSNLKKTYNSMLELYSKITNKFKDTLALFPSCELPDQEFFKRHSDETQSDIPGGLGKALVKAVKGSRVNFDPKEDSGLYVWQMNEIIPLVLKDTNEFQKFLINNKYSEILENEFISQWAGTRHTHVGHTSFDEVMIGSAMVDYTTPIKINPEFLVEPFSTSYLRMADSLGFLEKVLKNNIPEVLDRKRLMNDGSKNSKQIGEEFEDMILLLSGLSAISKDSIHQTYDSNGYIQKAKKTAYKWLENISEDIDINRNTAIFVPIIRTTDGSRQVSYIDAGFKDVKVNTEYKDKPEVQISPMRGYRFESKSYSFPTLIHREVRIPYEKLINDEELRKMLPEKFYEKDLDDIVSKLED